METAEEFSKRLWVSVPINVDLERFLKLATPIIEARDREARQAFDAADSQATEIALERDLTKEALAKSEDRIKGLEARVEELTKDGYALRTTVLEQTSLAARTCGERDEARRQLAEMLEDRDKAIARETAWMEAAQRAVTARDTVAAQRDELERSISKCDGCGKVQPVDAMMFTFCAPCRDAGIAPTEAKDPNGG